MEMGDQNVQGDLYRTYWQINNSNNIMNSFKFSTRWILFSKYYLYMNRSLNYRLNLLPQNPINLY